MHHEKLSAQGPYSYRELCVKIFHTTLQTAMYAQKPLTQTDIDRLPPLVRFVNEKQINDLGFTPHINPVFRYLAEKGKKLIWLQKLLP